MFTKAQKEHDWLQRLVGDWTSEMTGCAAAGADPQVSTGTETVRSIGGLWTLAEGTGALPDGSTMTSLTTLGFDPGKGRFVGTFLASMMGHLWIYEGTLSEDGRALVLETEGPAMTAPGLARYRDTITLLNADERSLTSHMLGADGQWTEFVKATYRRRR